MENNNEYFAVQDSEELARICLKKADSFFNTMRTNQYFEKLIRNWKFYHGIFNDDDISSGHTINFIGEQGELVELNVNHFRNFGQHIINMITAHRPAMQAQAVNTDYKSLAQTYIANSILEYYLNDKKLEDFIQKATELAVVMGVGYVRLEWNATGGNLYDFDPETGERSHDGELEFSVLSQFDVVFDGTKENWDNDYLIVRSRENRYNLIAKYPELKDKIENIKPIDSSKIRYSISAFSNDDTDDIYVYEFFHKRTEALPDGRYCLFLDEDTILLDLALPYREIPIYRIVPSEYLGTCYGYSPLFDIYNLQEASNSLYSTAMTNISAFGVQNLFVQKGSDLEINSLEGALNIIEGNIKPEPLQLTNTSPEVFSFLGMVNNAMETISGISSVTRGNPAETLKSGTALALVQSMSLQFISGLQKNYVKLIEDLGTGVINILKDFANTPRMMALVGKNNRPFLKEFKGSDISDISRTKVDVGNALARSVAGRVQMAEQMLQMGLIKNPQQYFQVINTGSIESMYQSDMDVLLLIRSENEQLMEGVEVLADILDDHKMHILEHRSVMADPDLRRDPQLRENVQRHIQEHIDMLRSVDPDLLMLLGQQPLQSQGVPQDAPPIAGPMPPQGQGMDPMMQDPLSQQMQGPQKVQGVNKDGSSTMGTVPQPARPPAPFEQNPISPEEMM